MANTQSAKYRFTVKEGEASASGRDDAPIFFMLEPMTGALNILDGGFMSLQLAPGTTMAEAKEISNLLNKKISTVGFTKL